jgi:hypothetical protein
MSIGIKIAQTGKSVDNNFSDLIFDTESSTTMCVKAYQIDIPIDPDWEETESRYEEILHHNLGYVPAVISYYSYDNGGTWYEPFYGMAHDENIISIESFRYYNIKLVIYVFAIDINNKLKSGGTQNFRLFNNKETKYGILSKRNSEEIFNTKYKKMPLTEVVPDVIPTGSSPYRFKFYHGLDSPVMYNLYGKLSYDYWTIDGRLTGMWKEVSLGMTYDLYTDLNNIYFDDYSVTPQYSPISGIIYGKLK